MELDFGNTPDKLKGEYLDMYNGVRSEVLCTTKFEENSDLSTTYFSRRDMRRLDEIKVEEGVSYIRTRLYSRKIVRWYRVSNIFRYRTK